MWKKIIDLFVALLSSTLLNILAVFSSISIIIAFINIEFADGKLKSISVQNPNIALLSISIGILIIVLIAHFFEFKKIKIKRLIKKIDKGFRMAIGNCQLNVSFDDIKNVNCSNPQSAIILPTNDSFDDECINDPKSSLGAFFQEHFPNGIKDIQGLIANELKNTLHETVDNIKIYPLSTAIYLNGPLGSKQHIILVSVTTKRKNEGIKSDPGYIAKGVLEVFKFSADKKLEKFYMPVLGAGHGGVDFNVALYSLLLEVIYNLKYKKFHHVKEINIIIYDPEHKLAKDVKNALYCVMEVLF